MERIPGMSFQAAAKTLKDADLANIFAQLQRMIQELRALPPPSGVGAESCIGGSLRDPRIPRSLPMFDPFGSIQNLHLWLRDRLRPEDHPEGENDEDREAVKKMAAKQDGPWPARVFTHGDLNPSNIIIRDSQVVGIIDWEFAGWYPYYWEYTSAWYGNLTR